MDFKVEEIIQKTSDEIFKFSSEHNFIGMNENESIATREILKKMFYLTPRISCCIDFIHECNKYFLTDDFLTKIEHIIVEEKEIFTNDLENKDNKPKKDCTSEKGKIKARMDSILDNISNNICEDLFKFMISLVNFVFDQLDLAELYKKRKDNILESIKRDLMKYIEIDACYVFLKDGDIIFFDEDFITKFNKVTEETKEYCLDFFKNGLLTTA